MQKNILKKGLVLGIILLFFGTNVVSGFKILRNDRGDILYVGGSEPGNYTKIQDAIDNASDGDTVFVYDDSSPYMELIIIGKSITLIGENKNTTIIDAGGNGDVVSITTDRVNISGFNIINGVDGIFLNSCINIIIKGNIIQYCQDGIELFYSNCTIIKENIIKNTNGTLSEFKVGGIDLNCSDNNVISHNIIQYNNEVAICLFRSNNNIIYSNSIEHNELCGVYIEDHSNNNKIIKNNFVNNKIYDGRFWFRSNRNKWDSNYWDKWIGHKFPFFNKLPKLILGWWSKSIPWFNFDWHPAKEPYEI